MLAAASATLLFGLIVTALALPVAVRITGYPPVLRLALGLAGALVVLYLAAGLIYVSGAAWSWLWLPPVAATIGCWRMRSAIAALTGDPAVRSTAAGAGLLALWCIGLHAVIFSYSGGAWAGDWFEHYERARFFLHRWPLDHAFLGFGALPARPPFANLVTGGLLGLSGDTFAHYQTFTTLLSCLVFFPLAALAASDGRDTPGLRLLPLLLMLNPLFVQNATFPWTKLTAAFFVVLAFALIRRSLDGGIGGGLALMMMSAGLITHYSAGPWIIALVAGWWWLARSRPACSGFRRELLAGGAAGALLAGTWLFWAAGNYGPQLLLKATSTVGDAPVTGLPGLLTVTLGNLRSTLLPDWQAPLFMVFWQQMDVTARLRDVFFILYQQNLPLAFGLGNLAVLLWLVRNRYADPRLRFWWVAGPTAVLLGIAVHTAPVPVGLAHICLQPLILFGLAGVAAAWTGLPRWLRRVWIGGVAVDFCLGVVLHFAHQSLLLPRWLHPGATPYELIGRWPSSAMLNYGGKQHLAQPFLADSVLPHAPWAFLVLAILLGLALVRGFRAMREMTSPGGPVRL
ncbi:MAG: hypothetical protein KIT44_09105 [Opitutaceae bacterium]|nr:hypothetical protein [Opitutaceae bacterium]